MEELINDKDQLLQLLRDEYNSWEDLLAGIDEAQAETKNLPYLYPGWSLKDTLAHLWAWQTRSVARMQAAVDSTQPNYSIWPDDLDVDSEEGVDEVNAWIYDASKDKPWTRVYDDWRNNFQRFIALSEQVPEKDLTAIGKYDWMTQGYPLAASLQGSYEHHAEHLEPLRAWRDEHGSLAAS